MPPTPRCPLAAVPRAPAATPRHGDGLRPPLGAATRRVPAYLPCVARSRRLPSAARPPLAAWWVLAWLATAPGLLVGAAHPVRADEAADDGIPPPPAAARELTDAEATAATEALEAAFRSTDAAVRRAGAEHAAGGDHVATADLLLKYLGKEKDADVRVAVIDALGNQRRSVKKVGARLLGAVDRIVEARSDQRKRSRPPVPLDANGRIPQTADAARLVAARRAESREVAHLVRAACSVGAVPKDLGASWAELLLDANDDVVVEALRAFGAWRPVGVLPAVHELFARYPTPARWEGGVVIDLAGDNASAKATWESRHGDPAGKRPRPRVTAAIHVALPLLAGRDFETPEALRAFLKAERGGPTKATR